MIGVQSDFCARLHTQLDSTGMGSEERPRDQAFADYRRADYAFADYVKLWRALSRQYRSKHLQVNAKYAFELTLNALAEIYTMHTFAMLENRITSIQMFLTSKTVAIPR